MTSEFQTKPWNRGRFAPPEDYTTAIHRIGTDLGADDAEKHLSRIARLRARAIEAQDPVFAAEAERIEGVLVARSGQSDRARKLLAGARATFLALEEWELAALSVADAAGIAYTDRELLSAADLYVEAADLAMREPNPAPEDAARYRGQAAQCHLESGDDTRAIGLYRIAVDLAQQAGDPAQAAIWCHDLGSILERIGDENAALEQWLRATKLDPDGDAASSSWSQISQIYRSWGRTDQARKAAERALATALEPEAARDARYHSLALAAEFEPTITLIDDLEVLAEEYSSLQNARQAAYCTVISAGLLYRAGRTPEAERAWDEASAVVANLEDWRSLADFHAERANKLSEARDTIGVRQQLTLAAEHYERADMASHVAACRRNLAALDAADDPQRIRDQWREAHDPVTREQAHELLGLAGVEFVLHRFNRAAELAERGLAFFTRHRLQHSELETRMLLAAIHTQTDAHDLATQQLHALLAATEGGMFPTIRAQALTIVGGSALRQHQIGPAGAAYRAALEILGSDDDSAASALARLNLALVTTLTDPEESLRHASTASAALSRQGHIGHAARADLAAAMALTRIGSWRGAFDIAAPALLVTDILRAATTSAPDRNRMREVWSMIHHRILEMIAEIDDPRLTAEILERLRANATVPNQVLPTASRADAPTMPVDVVITLDDGPAITWDTQWSAAEALLGPDRQLSAGLPPLVQMPWGIALEPYETISRQKLLGQSERHRRDRPVASWADQIGFA